MTSPAPLRIAHVLPVDGIGGVEVAAREGAARRPEVALLFVAGGQGGGRVRGALRTLRVLFGFDALWRLHHAGCDVAVFSLWKTAPLLLAWRLLLRRRALLFLHCDRSTHGLDAWLTAACARVADGVLADSATTAASRLPAAAIAGPVRVVSMLSAAAAVRPGGDAPRDPARLAYWGRLSASKRLDRCLRLFAHVHAQAPGSRFDLYGPDDGQRDALRARAAELGVAAAVHFHPPASREEVFAQAATAGWFLQASEFEGFCLGVAEAMQQGLVPVVTPVGEIGRYTRDGHNALWIGAGEDAEARAAARIVAAQRDREAFAALQAAAQATWIGAPTYPDSFVAQVAGLVRPAGEASPAENRDHATVDSFGAEWTRYDQAQLDQDERGRIFEEYFRVFPWSELPADAVGADIGSGSGRWARHVHARVGRLHCVDASEDALATSRRLLADAPNVEFHCTSVDSLPFAPGSLDFAYSLGVLHHVPDTAAAVASCARALRPGAPLLLYLYYALDGRPAWFRLLWRASDHVRRALCRLREPWKSRVTDAIAVLAYWPLARLARAGQRLGLRVDGWPLAYYRDHSLFTMRTDARDRFGTPLEQRFTLEQIVAMMRAAGLRDIRHSPAPPYWCVVGRREAAA